MLKGCLLSSIVLVVMIGLSACAEGPLPSALPETVAPPSQGEQPVEIDETTYPYLASIPPELERIIEVRYDFEIGVVLVPGRPLDQPSKKVPPMVKIPGEGIIEEGFIKNISNETITLQFVIEGYPQAYFEDLSGRSNVVFYRCYPIYKNRNTGEILGVGGAGGGGNPETLKPNEVTNFGGGMESDSLSESFDIDDPKLIFVEYVFELGEWD